MSFTGTLDKCKACDKTVYVVDMLSLEGVPYHKSCFKCSHCKGTLQVTMEAECYHKTCFRCAIGGCHLTHSSYAALDGVLYCKHHFAQLFMEKGNYNHILEAASHKRTASTPPPEPVEPAETEEAKPAEDADEK
ncbi:LIM domain-containing protein PLIM2b [Linum perenne]